VTIGQLLELKSKGERQKIKILTLIIIK